MEVIVLVLFDIVALPLLYLMSETCWNVVRPLSACQLPIYSYTASRVVARVNARKTLKQAIIDALPLEVALLKQAP